MTGKKITLFNPAHTNIVYTEAGHILGGGERHEVDHVDEVGQRLIDAGELLDVTPPPKKPTAARSGAPDQEDHA